MPLSKHKEIIDAASTPMAAYEALVNAGCLQADAGQRDAMQLLQTLHDELCEGSQRASSWRGFFGGKKDRIPDRCGIYLWGDVGRGKSMLMDIFYHKAPIARKTRIHFHAFMQDIHGRIHAWRQLKPGDDLIARIVKEIARDYRLICFDELQVHDITDAAILSRLFTRLFKEGVVVVFTSNRPPMDLYKNGIQRDQFMPFIELIERHMDVLKIRSDTDYRLEQFKALKQVYFYPLGAAADDFIDESYHQLTQGQSSIGMTLRIKGRQIRIGRCVAGIAWVTFEELCERPLGAADYLEISALFHTVVLQNIPQLSPEKRNEAKRFVTLIDTLYEQKVKLICSADASPDQLYINGDGSFEFERTASRLLEMQSQRYLGLEHRCK